MRFFEITIPVLLAIHLLWRRPHPLWIRLLPILTFIMIPLHIIVEGYRWQMIPLYVLSISLAIRTSTLRGAAGWKPLASFLTMILLAVSTALPILLPVPSLPAPSGPYKVGTRNYELTDPSRKELYSGKDEVRRFQIQVWYPAEVSSSDKRAPWMAHADIFAPAIASYIHMPSFFLDHLALVKMPAYQDSKVVPAEVGFPLILFSHGWNGFDAQNTGQVIELASHGYVVVAIQHTYGAIVTVFEDGRVAPNNPAALPSGAPDPEHAAAAQKLANQWAGDLAYTLGFMQEQNSDSNGPFYNAIDLSRIGVYGHSTGGGAAIQFCGTDARCKAVLGMDPFMRPVSNAIVDDGLSQPAFFLFSQSWAEDINSSNNELFHRFIAHVPQSFGVISIQGTTHYDFTDLPLLSPLAPKLGLKGPISGPRVTIIVNDYLIAFFDATLKGVPTSLFEGNNQKYNEVKFSK